jgi:predicted metal-dependent phosphoesterase TrpH
MKSQTMVQLAGRPTMPTVLTELHCHTCYSKDSLMLLGQLIDVARRRGLQRLAVTDHNILDGAHRAAEIDPELIIPGEEIMTTGGELLAYYVREHVPPGLTPPKTIEILCQQGAVISVAHPFDSMRAGHWDEAELREILPLVDAIEVFNARVATPAHNRRAAALAASAGKPGTAGSDAHAYLEVGRATTRLPAFNDAASLRAALASCELSGRLSPYWVHLLSRYATWRKQAGWRPPV